MVKEMIMGENMKSKWARILSDIGNPLIVITMLYFFVAYIERYPAKDVMLFLLWTTLIVGSMLVASALWVKIRRNLPNMDIIEREDRYLPYLASFVGYLILWLIAPARLPEYPMLHAVVMSVMLGVLICGLVNLKWKISFHGFSMGLFSSFVFHYNFVAGLIFLFLTVVIGWSRVYKGVHTWAQVFAGGLLGFTLGFLSIKLLVG
ncbi:phosphatase PAP2 family protein [bacterium 3DAC]|jgi:membrane-associated phospholipid phosphatase|nr:phosphatase PAP2 family protein [bacterium 3DAC]